MIVAHTALKEAKMTSEHTYILMGADRCRQ